VSFFSFLSCGSKNDDEAPVAPRQRSQNKIQVKRVEQLAPKAQQVSFGPSPSSIMNERYQKVIASGNLATCDTKDVKVLMDPSSFQSVDQFAPQCSQHAYMTMILSQDHVIGDYTKEGVVTPADRDEIVKLMKLLHSEKKYKNETLHIAVSIMDRYHAALARPPSRRPPSKGAIATICMLMAAKLEQPISPSFTRMINLVPRKYAANLDKQTLIALERDIIFAFQFDLQFASTLLYSQRLLKILGFADEE
jgi:hypothetical protein